MPVASPVIRVPTRSEPLALTWIGHSTFLIQCDGVNILTDPIWAERASPVSFAGPRRIVPAPIPLANLPPIDITLISHDHYDHLDDATARELIQRFPQMHWMAPLEVGRFLENRGALSVTEMDWWQESVIDGLTIGCTPAKHFSGRSPWNRNGTLWCGWTIAFDNARVYFAGDTALHPEFGNIATRFGPFDVAILPIGAYEPRWFMRAVHMTPEDSVEGFGHLLGQNGGAACIMAASHWGTFPLTDEPVMEPPYLAKAAWQRTGRQPENLWIFQHGETRRIDGM